MTSLLFCMTILAKDLWMSLILQKQTFSYSDFFSIIHLFSILLTCTFVLFPPFHLPWSTLPCFFQPLHTCLKMAPVPLSQTVIFTTVYISACVQLIPASRFVHTASPGHHSYVCASSWPFTQVSSPTSVLSPSARTFSCAHVHNSILGL